MSMASENDCPRNTRLPAGTRLIYRSCHLAGSHLWWLSAQGLKFWEYTVHWGNMWDLKTINWNVIWEAPKSRDLLHGFLWVHLQASAFQLLKKHINTCPPRLPALLCLDTNEMIYLELGTLYKVRDVMCKQKSLAGWAEVSDCLFYSG